MSLLELGVVRKSDKKRQVYCVIKKYYKKWTESFV